MPKDIENFKMINDLLEYKLQLLNQIYDLTKLQCEKIEEYSIDRLLNLIDSKEIRIDKIRNIDIRYLNMLKKNEANSLSELSFENELILSLKDKEKKIKELAGNIYQIEKDNEENLKIKMNIIKEKLRASKQSKKVTSSYYKIPTQVGGYFIDNKK